MLEALELLLAGNFQITISPSKALISTTKIVVTFKLSCFNVGPKNIDQNWCVPYTIPSIKSQGGFWIFLANIVRRLHVVQTKLIISCGFGNREVFWRFNNLFFDEKSGLFLILDYKCW